MTDLHVRGLHEEEIPDIAALWRRSRFDALPEFEMRQGRSLEEDVEYLRSVFAPEFDVWVAELEERPVAFLATKIGILERLFRGIGRSRNRSVSSEIDAMPLRQEH